jgi:CrcB protein
MVGTLVQIAIGGALGALARFGTQSLALRLMGPTFPIGTLAANVVGSFLMGFAVAWLVDREFARFLPFFAVGFLGAYTTFSTYAIDAVRLWEKGETMLALGYVFGSVVLCIAACLAGLGLGRSLMA